MAKEKRRMKKPIVTLEEPDVTSVQPRPPDETRSHFVSPSMDHLPSDTDPCGAPEGNHWVHAYSPHMDPDEDRLLTGKWLIRVGHTSASYCWERVRSATDEGTLGFSAKVSTDWGMKHDPAGFFAEGGGGWRTHIVCVYTRDWRDRDDVLRVGKRLVEVDAVRTQPISYKPDALTFDGVYAGNSPGQVAVYRMAPPYEELQEYADNIKAVSRVVAYLRRADTGATRRQSRTLRTRTRRDA